MSIMSLRCKSYISIALICNMLFSCAKKNTIENVNIPYKLSYSDSVLYSFGETTELEIVSPVIAKSGTYTSFPAGLEINNNTGDINVHESETGLKYRVYFTSQDGKVKDSTLVIVGGINYLDGVYKINTHLASVPQDHL
jgi:hypothetical protein